MLVLKSIFYFGAVLFIIYEIAWILEPQRFVNKIIQFKQLEALNKGKKYHEWSDEYREALKKNMVFLLLAIWWGLGLFTYNWVAFALLILFNALIISPLGKLFEYDRRYTVLHWINSVIGLLFGMFIIINTYHLKIDLWEWLVSQF